MTFRWVSASTGPLTKLRFINSLTWWRAWRWFWKGGGCVHSYLFMCLFIVRAYLWFIYMVSSFLCRHETHKKQEDAVVLAWRLWTRKSSHAHHMSQSWGSRCGSPYLKSDLRFHHAANTHPMFLRQKPQSVAELSFPVTVLVKSDSGQWQTTSCHGEVQQSPEQLPVTCRGRRGPLCNRPVEQRCRLESVPWFYPH